MVNGSRVQSLMNTSYCTTIKNRGIRIAVLYTTYLPLPTNSWYNSYIKPFQPNIGSNLQSCASPGLHFQVSTDQDISGALAQLFNIAVETAHLTTHLDGSVWPCIRQVGRTPSRCGTRGRARAPRSTTKPTSGGRGKVSAVRASGGRSPSPRSFVWP